MREQDLRAQARGHRACAVGARQLRRDVAEKPVRLRDLDDAPVDRALEAILVPPIPTAFAAGQAPATVGEQHDLARGAGKSGPPFPVRTTGHRKRRLTLEIVSRLAGFAPTRMHLLDRTEIQRLAAAAADGDRAAIAKASRPRSVMTSGCARRSRRRRFASGSNARSAGCAPRGGPNMERSDRAFASVRHAYDRARTLSAGRGLVLAAAFAVLAIGLHRTNHATWIVVITLAAVLAAFGWRAAM